MNVGQARRALNPEQRQILDKRELNFKGSPDDLIKLLTPIASFDEAIGARSSSVPLGCASLFAPVIAIGSCASAVLVDAPYTVWVPVFVVSLIATIVVWRMVRDAKKSDISDNVRLTLIPLLKILREDVARGEPIHLHLDLRLPTDKAKSTGTKPAYKRGRYFEIVETLYEDPWVTARARLNDGALMAFAIVDSLRVIKRTKRGSSGKVRTNTRERKKTRIKVQLAVRKDGYEVVAPKDGKVRSTDRRHVISLTRVSKATDLSPISPMPIVDAVADAYRGVRRVRKEARSL